MVWAGPIMGVFQGVMAAMLWLMGATAASACFVVAAGDALPGRMTAETGSFGIRAAWYENETDIYSHNILGGIRDATRLNVVFSAPRDCQSYEIEAGRGFVFEDIAPRLVDLTGDGVPEIIAVRSSLNEGAQLAIYGVTDGELRYLTGTPHIGTRFRWLAPVAATDLDGDGAIELAFVDRPHLARTLRVWRWEDGTLRELPSLPGVTNHRIGDRVIFGGVRDCGPGPEMILADGNWETLLAVRFDGAEFLTRDLGLAPSADRFQAALSC